VFLALAAFAAEIIVWPLIGALLLGLPAAIVGVVLASRPPRRNVAVVVNLMAALGHLGGLVLIILPVVLAVEQRYVIPEGYMGEIVIVHGIAQGVPEKRAMSGAVTYDIPKTGVLMTSGQPDRSWIRTKYFYRQSDGSLRRIQNRWNTTIHDTLENRADPSVGIYLRSGIGVMKSPNCRDIEFQSFVVGTKTFILSGYEGKGRQAMLEVERLVCGTASRSR